jgi:hypothetical protein
MKHPSHFLRWALAALTLSVTAFSASAQDLAAKKAAMLAAQNDVAAKTTALQSQQSGLTNQPGFQQLNPLYQEALKLNITASKFNESALSSRRDWVNTIAGQMQHALDTPQDPTFFKNWVLTSGPWFDAARSNFIQFLAHARVREAYLSGKGADEIKRVNQYLVDIANTEKRIATELLPLLPWPGKVMTWEGPDVSFNGGIALYGDGQKQWRAWGASKGTVKIKCNPYGDGFRGDPAPGVRKMCIFIPLADIQRGTYCALNATCNMPDANNPWVSFQGGYEYYPNGGSFRCGNGGGCWVLNLDPAGRSGYQDFVNVWPRVIE